MEFLDLIQKRYSVRKYKSESVEEEKLKLILEAARLAPTAHNQQPFKLIVIKNNIVSYCHFSYFTISFIFFLVFGLGLSLGYPKGVNISGNTFFGISNISRAALRLNFPIQQVPNPRLVAARIKWSMAMDVSTSV